MQGCSHEIGLFTCSQSKDPNSKHSKIMLKSSSSTPKSLRTSAINSASTMCFTPWQTLYRNNVLVDGHVKREVILESHPMIIFCILLTGYLGRFVKVWKTNFVLRLNPGNFFMLVSLSLSFTQNLIFWLLLQENGFLSIGYYPSHLQNN